MTREGLVAEARSWHPTPYKRRGTIKHVGADCGSFLACVLADCGFIGVTELYESMKQIESLADDWFMHKAEGVYVELMGRFIPKIKERMTYGLPGEPAGNILLMQTGNSNKRNHGAFVTVWPKVIHCMYEGVREVNLLFDPMWNHKSVSVYDPFQRKS